MSKPRILLADDHTKFLEAVATHLKPTFEIIARVGDGQSLVEAAKKLSPDVIVTDISMPILNGIDAVKELKESGSSAKVVFLTVHFDPDFVRACFINGASAFVVKSRMATDLVPAIQAALAGHIFASPDLLFQIGG